MLCFAAAASAQPIDRHALVTRHNVELTAIDPHAPLMVGNGDLAFTADITGLQTFPEHYSALAPLLTMAQWAWHSFPNPQGWSEEDGLVQVPVPGGGTQPYPWIRDWAELTATRRWSGCARTRTASRSAACRSTLDGEPPALRAG